MTETTPETAALNGLPPIPSGPPPDPDNLAALSARVDALAARLQILAVAIAGILAERMQPQIQNEILAQLTGNAAPPP